MSELKLVTRNIRINGIQHKASDMSEEEIKCLLIQRQDIAMAIFTAITQGILIAGLSTYVNQIVKQANKDE